MIFYFSERVSEVLILFFELVEFTNKVTWAELFFVYWFLITNLIF